jgi:hypothetical protein
VTEFQCCDNPAVEFVREEAVKLLQENPIGDGTREYYKCLNCGVDHVRTISRSGQPLDHRKYGLRTA